MLNGFFPKAKGRSGATTEQVDWYDGIMGNYFGTQAANGLISGNLKLSDAFEVYELCLVLYESPVDGGWYEPGMQED